MLFVVRHGQTAANAAGQLLGRADVPLTETGRQQAKELAAAVGPVDRVISSPLQRARDTATAFGLPIEIDERWTELDYGEYDDRPPGDVPPELWQRWRADPGHRPPGGESLVELGLRVRAACADVASRAAEADVVVVSHVSPIKAAVAWALGVGPEISWRMHLDVAAITRIHVGTSGTLEEILYGPACTDDGTQNLVGALRTCMGTVGASRAGLLRSIIVHSPPAMRMHQGPSAPGARRCAAQK